MPAIAGRNFTNGDSAIGVGLLVALIASFLPWYSVSANGGAAGFNYSVSINAFSHWPGVLFLIALLAGIAFFVIRNFVPTIKVPDLPQPDAVLYIVVGVFMAAMAVVYLLTTSGDSISGPGFSSGPSFGLFVGLLAAIAVAVGGFLKRSDAEPIRHNFDTPASGSTYGGGAPPTV